ncbi:unnamed protein product [Symbiodinium microadriaticum]|nr:unnamed protein product [Symbiodinium microadriaticum]
MEMYRKVRLKRIKAQPTREEIEEHMLRYRQMKLEHIEQEKGYAEARKKDWRKKNGQLRKIGAGVASPQKHKVDFVEEQRLREKEEEEMRKMRIERGKEYGDAVRGGSDLPPSPRATDKLHSHVPPRGQSSEDPLHVDVTPSPDRHLPQHHYHTPTKHGHQHHRGVNAELDVVALVPNSPRSNKGSPRTTSANEKVKAAAPRRNEHSPKPPQAHHPSSSQAGSDKSPEKKETKARKFITHQSSAMEGDPGSPYDGKVGVDWVAEVMDVDGEEDNLAVVYETGFSMLMVEKGIINSGDLYDELLTDGMVVATPPVKGRLMPSSLMVTEATDSRDVH